MNAPTSRSYALGHSERELARLARQAQLFRPFTQQLFHEAGISRGMRVLDFGSGSGDVAFLAADLVGPTGQVVGMDRSAASVAFSNERAQTRKDKNVRFVESESEQLLPEEQFDAVVGRLVLMYCQDPAETIRALTRRLRPGGLVVFQEFDMENCRSFPAAPVFDRAVSWIISTLKASGARVQLGLELFAVYLAAGLPAPSMRVDSLIGGGPDLPAYDLIADVVQSLLVPIEKFGVATPAEVQIETLRDRMRDELVSSRGVAVSPALVGAWSRIPG